MVFYFRLMDEQHIVIVGIYYLEKARTLLEQSIAIHSVKSKRQAC